jgi:hypothetical protein
MSMRRFGGSKIAMASGARQDTSSSVYSGAKIRDDFYKQSAIALPAVGTSAVVVSKAVPYGRNGFLWKIGIDYVGPGFTEGSGALIYQVFRNAALTRGVKGFVNLTASMGSVNNPVEIPAVQIYEGEIVSIVVNNASLAVGGAQLVGVLVGWYYPRSEEGGSQWS